MKTRAELAEAVCEAANKVQRTCSPQGYEQEQDYEAFAKALSAWRNAPPDPPELKITPGPMILSPSDERSHKLPESC